MFRDENLLIDFLMKKAHKKKLCQQKNVDWICVLNLNFRLWNQHKADNNLHIQMTHDLIWIVILNAGLQYANLQVASL